MNILLFDDEARSDLLPLCFTRPCGNLRVGILTISEKWNVNIPSVKTSYITQDYLSNKFPATYDNENIYVNGRVLPNKELCTRIAQLPEDRALFHNEVLIALKTKNQLAKYDLIQQAASELKSESVTVELINFTYDIFSKNGAEIKSDYALLTENKTSAKLSATNTVIGTDIFVEEGASVEAATINCTKGPVYIGKNSTIMEGSLIRGPFALCNDATVKMGAKIYGDTTIGPQCKVGGEVSNTLFYARSSKGHDGFLGNSVVGEWCNLGADTNSSNLKNNYAEVKLWNYTKERFLKTGLQFCGLIMGDHSKCGINTMFNTGTVVGVSANIFGASFPRNFIPSFTWGGATGFTTYAENKAFETAKIVMLRRDLELTEQEKNILSHISKNTNKHRFWEKKPINT